MRHIDADALIADVRKHSESYFADDFAREWVDKQPTADVAPVRHGRWERKTEGMFYWYECSNCKHRPPRDHWNREWYSYYCPNCGAIMDGGADDEIR